MIPHFTDHAANERTYLAWVRVALSLAAFGFLLEKFGVFLTYGARAVDRAAIHSQAHVTEWFGLLLLFFGSTVVLLATYRFRRRSIAIESQNIVTCHGDAAERLVTTVVVLMVIFLMAYVGREVIALS